MSLQGQVKDGEISILGSCPFSIKTLVTTLIQSGFEGKRKMRLRRCEMQFRSSKKQGISNKIPCVSNWFTKAQRNQC